MAAFALALLPPARAATNYWSNSLGGNLTNAANWIGGVPGGADTAAFTNGAAYALEISSVATNANAVFDGSATVTLNVLAGNSWGLTNASSANFAGSLKVDGAATSAGNLLLTNGTLNAARIIVGFSDGNGVIRLSKGATVTSGNPGTFLLGIGSGGRSNSVTLTDAGTLMTNLQTVSVGYQNVSSDNSLIVSNGAVLVVGAVNVSAGVGNSNNSVIVTGAGSILRQSASLRLGTNSTTVGYGGSALVADGAVWEVGTIVGGLNSSGTFSNRSGILQFTSASPSLTPNTAGSFVMTNGIISYRGVSAADITSRRVTTNFVMQGDSGFRLLDSTNLAGLAAYTFDSVANTGVSTNFQRLILSGNASRWQGGTLGIGAGGEILITNAVNATVGSLVNATGAIRVVNSTVTWQSNVVLAGSYFSDPSTNTFASNLVVTASGSLYGSNGDLFVFYKDFANQSTNRSLFNLASATVLFTNGGGTTSHVLDLTGGGSLEMGSNWLNAAQLATNFSLGTLSLAAGNSLTLSGTSASNALYVGWLDLGGTTNNLSAQLSLAVNLYYEKYNPNNAYLNGLVYSGLGAGSLIPIPEPSSVVLVVLASLMALGARRRRI